MGLVLALEAVPAGRLALLPLHFLNTHVHEFCHALAALASNGAVGAVVVRADASGTTPVVGGWLPLVASAGYAGSACAGGLLLASSRTERGARAGLWGLAGLMLATMVLFVRGDLVGLVAGWAWAAVLVALARKLRGPAAVFAAQAGGALLCLASWQSFLALFHAGVAGHSDATILQEATGVPAVFWASAWLALSALAVLAGLRAAWKGGRGR